MEGKLYVITGADHNTPGNLRAKVQFKLRDVIKGTIMDKRVGATDDVQVVNLDADDAMYSNYRSGQLILDRSHRLIKWNDPERLEARAGFDKHLVADRDIAAFFYGRFRDFCTATPARRNLYLQFCFFGRVLFPEALPEYLSEEGMRRIRTSYANIAWRLESYQEALGESAPGRFNKFHLSNIGDWMGREEYAGLLALVCAKAGPSSRAVSRYIHLDHPLPEALRERIVRRDDRGQELVRSDRFPFYNLVVMELR
jgi:hypothetical protein